MCILKKALMIFVEVKTAFEQYEIEHFLFLGVNELFTRNFEDVFMVDKGVNVDKNTLFSKGSTG
jgi:hypothetical protein